MQIRMCLSNMSAAFATCTGGTLCYAIKQQNHKNRIIIKENIDKHLEEFEKADIIIKQGFCSCC